MVYQSKSGSVFESILGTIIGAPTGMILHWHLLALWGDQLDIMEMKQLFIGLSWISFFAHSIFWKFAFRRIFDKYGKRLEPTNLLKKIKSYRL